MLGGRQARAGAHPAQDLLVRSHGEAHIDAHTHTPPRRHLAAAEGCYSAVVWLLAHGVDVNPVDRFKRTPLEVRGAALRPSGPPHPVDEDRV